MIPSPELDDTQPTAPIPPLNDSLTTPPDVSPHVSNEDTQPFKPLAARRSTARRPMWRKTGTNADDDLRGLAWFAGVGLAGALVMAAVILVLIFAARTPAIAIERTISLEIDGSTTNITSHAATVAQVLAEQGIPVDENTTVSPDLSQPVTDGLVIRVDQQRPITLTVNGQTSFFYTVMDNPQDILDSAEISVNGSDEVRVNGVLTAADRLADFPLPANTIDIRFAKSITVQLEEETITMQTTAATVGDALMEAGVELFLGDNVSPSVDTALDDAQTITITRSIPITIEADGVTTETRVKGGTVGEALAEQGVVLVGLDYAVPPENAKLRPDMNVRVVRVTEEVIAEDVVVEYETVYQADAEVELDQRRVLQAGQNGIDQRRTVIRYENGVEVRRREEGLTRVKDPVDQIIGYGTKVVIRTLDTPEGPVEYWRKFRMYATSYHPEALGGDDVTATGARLTKGIVAINPRIIPYGTRVYVPDYGMGLAADTGGARSSPYWIDLGYDDDNYRGWHWWHDVYLLTPVPENITYLLPAHPNP